MNGYKGSNHRLVQWMNGGWSHMYARMYARISARKQLGRAMSMPVMGHGRQKQLMGGGNDKVGAHQMRKWISRSENRPPKAKMTHVGQKWATRG